MMAIINHDYGLKVYLYMMMIINKLFYKKGERSEREREREREIAIKGSLINSLLYKKKKEY